MRNQCPNEETLTDFLEGRLSERQQTRVESHLAACAECREMVGVYVQLTHPESATEPVTAPEYLTDKAVRLVAGLADRQQSRSLVEGARRWAARGIAILEQMAPSNGMQPVPVRSAETTLSEQRIRRQKQFGALSVTIEIERIDDDLALIRVVNVGQPLPDPPVRVTLAQGEREIASLTLGSDPQVFDDIAFGIYTLVFTHSGASLGEYRFEITAGDDDAQH